MRRAVTALPKDSWPPDRQIATVTLAFDDRHRRRVRMTDDSGEPFLLDLAQATLLNDGDGLGLEGDGVIAVRAAREPVLDIAGQDPAHTARLAWHVGNRHVPLQVLDDGRLRIRADHVLEAMLIGLGAEVTTLTAPFAPEPGAYAGHGHDH